MPLSGLTFDLPQRDKPKSDAPFSMGGVDNPDPRPEPRPYKSKAVAKPPPAQDPVDLAYTGWHGAGRKDEHLDGVLTAASQTIDRGITTHAGKSSPLVKSKARLLAAQAVRSYKPDSGANLKTWINQHLQGLTRYRQQLSPLKMPERVGYDLAHLSRTERDLEDELGRPATEDELQDRAGFSRKRLTHIRQYRKQVLPESSLVDADGENYLPGIPNGEADALWAQYVYKDLDPVNQRVYDMMMGRNGYPKHSVNDVARALKISAAAVSQRTDRIARMLEEGSR